MTKWRYKIATNLGLDDLNSLGIAGWELVAIRSEEGGIVSYFFKMELIETPVWIG